MSVLGVKKPLHLAKNIKVLNQLANTPFKHENPRALAKSTQMLLKRASESLLEGDQETAYVLYMRFFNVVTYVRKSKEYIRDKKYYDGLIGDKNCKTAIEKAEELSEALKTRYEELEALEVCKKLDMATREKAPDSGRGTEEKVTSLGQMDPTAEDDGGKSLVNKKIQTAMIDSSAPIGWVSVQMLYEWLKNSSILLVDVRGCDQFDSSHFTSFKDIINTPDVLAGSTAKNIEIKLSGPSLICWARRAQYDAIIICDLDTTDTTFDEKTSPLAHLKNALIKWDLEMKLKNEPLFLLGGYKEWAFTFPMFVNKPLPSDNFIGGSKLQGGGYNEDMIISTLDSIDYDIDLSFLTTPQVPILSHEYSFINAPVTNQGIPTVDRSKKPRKPSMDDSPEIDKDKGVMPVNGNLPSALAPPPKHLYSSIPVVNRNLKPSSSSSSQNPLNRESSDEGISSNDEGIGKMHNSDNSTVRGSILPQEQARENDNNQQDLQASIFKSQEEMEKREQLRREIETLEGKKRLLVMEVADIDRKKAENDKKKIGEGVDSFLLQQKAKEARDVATLLRQKKKLTQELDEMMKLKQNQQLQNHQQVESDVIDDAATKPDATARHTPVQSLQKSTPAAANDAASFSSSTVQSKFPNNRSPVYVNQLQPPASSSQKPVIGVSPSHQVPSEVVRKDIVKPPLQPTPSATPTIHPQHYTIQLKDGEDTSGEDDSTKSNLKRSHSSPNIAKLIDEAGGERKAPIPSAAVSYRPNPQRSQQPKVFQPSSVEYTNIQPPKVDRSIKPMNSHKALLEAKVRNFQPLWGSTFPGLTGLRNLGNTCYMNSIIQCLSNCYTFCHYFSDNQYGKDINPSNQDGFRGEVAIEFAMLVKNLWCGQYKAISPNDFRMVVSKLGPMFASSQHQDAQELLEYLMNGLNEDLNRVRTKPQLQHQNNDKLEDEIAAEKAWHESLLVEKSIVVDLFRGQYKSRVMCSHCETKSTVFEPFMSLTLQIPESQSKCSLSDCLLHFSNEEKMTGDSKWLCPHCKQKREATKRIVVWRLPQILIVHLKRFHYQGIWRNKISSNVTFPINNLDMSRYLSGPRSYESNRNTIYNLFAVCNHYGTLDGGHYTAYCKNIMKNNWFKFDDSDVSEISTSSTQSPAAYLLFYTKSN